MKPTKEPKTPAAPLTDKQKKNRTITAVAVGSLVVALAIILFLMSFFGVFKRQATALELSDGTKISEAEYEYYYTAIQNSYIEKAKQYDQYYGPGSGAKYVGLDPNQLPSQQPYTKTKLDAKIYGDKPTWADFFESQAIQSCEQYTAVYKKAIAEGYKPDNEIKDKVDEFVEQIRAVAEKEDYSLGAYLRIQNGKGMNESLLRDIMTGIQVSSKYLEEKSLKMQDAIGAEAINAEFEKEPDAYLSVDLRIYYIAKDDPKLTSQADEILSKITLDNFTETVVEYAPEENKEIFKNEAASTQDDISKETLVSAIDEDAADWAFAKDRKTGDKAKFENESAIFIIAIKKAPYKNDLIQPIDVRHILVKFDENKAGDANEQKRVKEKAEKLLADFNKGKKTETAFAKIAKKESEDPGSAENGGLIVGIYKNSNYVQPFLDWCYASGRKVGDTGLVKSEYGYHVMYCSHIAKRPRWQQQIVEKLTADDYQKFVEEVMNDKKFKLKETNRKTIIRVRKDAEKAIIGLTAKDKSKNQQTPSQEESTTKAAK
ncbi:MAG: peptidylprolyl isomerase [Clostridia bacterium]|nr:peptidylprolyl isomerase [Clostridia bacterium]